MKVALLSFHNAYNYGAALQAYALQEAVKSLGIECEYIDYINEYRRNAYDVKHEFVSAVKNKKLKRAIRVALGAPFIIIRSRNFERFYSRHLKKTSETYRCSEEAATLNDKYDKFIVGSDQVWNPENNGGDMAYLLDFVRDSRKKISYSSSFGVDSLPYEFHEKYSKALGGFSRLSVREARGVELIKEMTGRDAQLVFDPVFLLEKDVWDDIRQSIKNGGAKKNRRKYIFFYTNRSTQVKDFMSTGYCSRRQEIHILSSHVKPHDFWNPHTKVTVSMQPENFLNEVAEASLVVTASFHCLAFAIIFQKQFCVLLTGNHGKDERILSLLRLLGLEDRILTQSTKPQDISKPINYTDVNRRIKAARDKSWEYLESAICDRDFTVRRLSKDSRYFCEDMRCTGCSACASICPTGAISMTDDDEGFRIPIRDKEACIDCGRCHEVCQVFRHRNRTAPRGQRYFAVKNTSEVRQQSSSGGMFTAISDLVLSKGGIIAGAVMGEDFTVNHKFAFDKYCRDQMRNTCYVQSNLGEMLSDIKALLADGKTVLFVGTPCQVEGLKLFIGNKPDNLILCDLLCHGAPSPGVFSKFIDFLNTKGKLNSFQFRDKRFGWHGYTVSADIGGELVRNRLWLQSFNNMFSHSIINRVSCASCSFTNYNRPGDITIGDFWGIERVMPELADKLGVSLVITNTKLGEDVLRSVDGIEKVEMNKESTLQNSLRKSAPISPNRYQAFKTLKYKGYKSMAKHYGEWNAFGYIKNIVRRALFH